MHCEGIQCWHEGVPLLTPFALNNVVLLAIIVKPCVEAATAIKLPGKRQKLRPRSQAFKDCLETWSKAPTASTDRTVARGSMAVAVWRSLYKPSVPARVLKPNWYGRHASWNAAAKCRASTRATRRLKTFPMTRTRTRPLGLRSATIRPMRMVVRISSGTLAFASRSVARLSRPLSDGPSNRRRKCSLVVPEGPVAEPRRAPLRQPRGSSAGSGHADAGWCVKIASCTPPSPPRTCKVGPPLAPVLAQQTKAAHKSTIASSFVFFCTKKQLVSTAARSASRREHHAQRGRSAPPAPVLDPGAVLARPPPWGAATVRPALSRRSRAGPLPTACPTTCGLTN